MSRLKKGNNSEPRKIVAACMSSTKLKFRNVGNF